MGWKGEVAGNEGRSVNKKMGTGGVGEGRGRDGGEIKRDEGCPVSGGPPVHTRVESNLIGKWKGKGRMRLLAAGGEAGVGKRFH